MPKQNNTKETESATPAPRVVNSLALASAVLDILECDLAPTLLRCNVQEEVEKLGHSVGIRRYGRGNIDQLAKDLMDRYEAEMHQALRHNDSETNYEFNIVLEADSMAALKADAAAAYRTIEQQVEAIVVSYLGTENVLVDPARIEALRQTESLTINPNLGIPETSQIPPLLPEQERMRQEFDESTVMDSDDVIQLLKGMLAECHYNERFLYGLLFMVGSFKKLIDSYKMAAVYNICDDVFRSLYRETANVDAGASRLEYALPTIYRTAKFSADPTDDPHTSISEQFVYAEQVAPLMDAHGDPFDAENLTTERAAHFLDTILSSRVCPPSLYNLITKRLTELDPVPESEGTDQEWIERAFNAGQAEREAA